MSRDKKQSRNPLCPAGEHNVTDAGEPCPLSPEPTDHVSDHAAPGFGISMNQDDYDRTPSVVGGANYFPGTEDWLPVGEMRVSFLGTAPYPPRLQQSGTSILLELGQGTTVQGEKVPKRPKRLIFDAGPGSSKMATALGIPWQEIDTFFLTHLHGDHIIELGYYFCFGAWGGRWNPLTIVGPDGKDSDPYDSSDDDSSRGSTYPIYKTYENTFNHDNGLGTPLGGIEADDGVKYGSDGTVAMVDGMKKMYNWHAEAFSMFPAGDGYEVNVHQFHHDATTGGAKAEGLCYVESWGELTNKQTIKVYHWNRVHGRTGASGYRLEWTFFENAVEKTLKFVWTGDGRPDEVTIANNKDEDVDLFVTECQVDASVLMGAKYNFPPDQYEYTIDTHHTVPYAVGDLMNKCGPRMGMVTHFEYDRDTMTEFIAGVRFHWNGMFALGAPDGIMVNLTKDAIWYRDAAAPGYAGTAQPSGAWGTSWQAYYDSRIPSVVETPKDPHWLHDPVDGAYKTFTGTNELPVPNKKYAFDDSVDDPIRQQEKNACEYYPEEVNRPRRTTTEDDVEIPLTGTA